MITVVIPTIEGREQSLERTVASYEQHTEDLELIVLNGYDACGPAWQEGGERAAGEFIHFSADDIEAHEGWWQQAVEVCGRDLLPAPVIYHTSGSVQSCGGSWERMEEDGAVTEFTRVPFVSREQWSLVQPMLPCHYFTDNWVSVQGRKHGIETVVCHGYQLTHHLSQIGRNETRMGIDSRVFTLACAGADVWSDQ